MELVIIGFRGSGKSTVFQALTAGKGESGSRKTRGSFGVVKVPDPRLDTLQQALRSQKIIPAEITYVDVPGALAGLGEGKGIGGQFLDELARADAIVHVVRAFGEDEPSAPDIAGIKREMAAMDLELAFSDLAILERRGARVEAALKSSKPEERDAAHKEMQLLARVRAGLEAETPVRDQPLPPDERRRLGDFQLLTAKPLLVVLNIAEGLIPKAPDLERAVLQSSPRPVPIIAVCGKLEAELAQLGEADARAFMAEAGIAETGLRRMARLSYQALGLVTFFTGNNREAHAWAVRRGSTAPQAAGKVHTDMERGFIRAEVVGCDQFVAAGGMAEARKRGVLRVEGKSYVVQDGDVITFLFNV